MELQKLQQQALQLPIRDRWRLVKTVLTSIQQDTLSSTFQSPEIKPSMNLDPWIQSLIGVIQINSEDSKDSYVDYLEEKYS